MQSLSS